MRFQVAKDWWMAGTALSEKDLENASVDLQNLTKDREDTRALSMVFVDLILLKCVVRSRCWRAERGEAGLPMEEKIWKMRARPCKI
jgi:hypothetical protein